MSYVTSTKTRGLQIRRKNHFGVPNRNNQAYS